MKKTLVLFIVFLMIAIPLSACQSADAPVEPTEAPTEAPTSTAPESADPTAAPEAEPDYSDFKAAILLTGSISDVGFSGPAYQGMKKLEEDFGIQISYSEKVQPTDFETIYRGYAQEGYNLIIGHGNQFLETASKVAEEYPDILFAVTSAPAGNGKNLAAIGLSSNDVGFLVGALCGQMTKSNRIASIAGSEIPPLIAVVKGTIVGAKYVNPDAEVVNVYTGSVDAAKVKEAAIALIDSGCDILTQTADIGSTGGINACAEKGIFNVATSGDYAPQAPKTVLASVMVKNDVAIYTIGKMAIEGTLEPKLYPFGIAEGAVVMTGYGELEDQVPAEVKEYMAQLIKDIEDGKIVTADLYAAYDAANK
jgi:basic membrane protein A